MKFKNLLLPLSSVLVISAAPTQRIPTYNSDIALARFDNSENLTLPITIYGTIKDKQEFIVSMYNAETDAKVYTKSYLNPASNFDIALPIKNRVKASGLRIQIDRYIAGNLRNTSSGVIYPYKKNYINITSYRNEPYISRGNYFAISTTNVKTDEEFDFTDINEYLSTETNNILDLSQIQFRYTAFGSTFTCGDIYFNIVDYNNVFPHLNKVNNVISLKMKATQNLSKVSLSLDTQLYVNSNTLEMYLYESLDCVSTCDLYIPAGKEEDFINDDIYISIRDAGYSQTDFTIPFNYYYSKKYFGECYDSDYCIHGGIRE